MMDIAHEVLVQVLAGAVMFLAGFIASMIRSKRTTDKAIREGLRAILKYEIVKICIRSTLYENIAYEDNEALTSMYAAYVSLGGNGNVKELIERVRDYPIVTTGYLHKRKAAEANA